MVDELLIEVVKILGSAIVGGGATYFWQHIVPERRRRRALVDRLESELFHAAHELQKRLYNLVELAGWVFLDNPKEPQRDLVRSTLYRIGRYLAYAEIWKRHKVALRKVRGKKADDVFAKMEEISKGFSSDTAFSSQKLRLFTDTQAEFGQSLIEGEGDQVLCLSIYGFRERMEEPALSGILDPIKGDVVDLKKELSDGHTDRLVYLQNKLIDLLDLLDPEKQKIRKDRKRAGG